MVKYMQRLKYYSVKGLRWVEQHTKTDMVYLAKGGFWTILSQVVVSFTTFLMAIAFAHFISKEIYGEYKFILSIASILGTFTLTGLGTGVMQSVSNGYEGTLRYAFWQNIRWSALFFVTALGMSVYYFINDNQSLGTAMLIIGSFSPFLKSTNFYNAYLVAKKDFRRSSIYYNIIGNLFPSAFIFLTLLITDEPIWLVVAYFASNTTIGIILYIRTTKLYKPNNKIDENIMNYSKHLSFMDILAGVANNIDQVFIFHYIGPVQLAIYNFAVAIPAQIKGPMKGLAGLIFPKFTERTDREIRAGMNNKFLLLFIASVLIITVYLITAPYIFQIFFPKYIDSVIYSQILSLSLLWIISIPADTYLVAKKKIKEQYINNILGSVMQITLLFIGIIYWGLMGLVVARVVIQLIWSIISIILYEVSSKKAVEVC